MKHSSKEYIPCKFIIGCRKDVSKNRASAKQDKLAGSCNLDDINVHRRHRSSPRRPCPTPQPPLLPSLASTNAGAAAPPLACLDQRRRSSPRRAPPLSPPPSAALRRGDRRERPLWTPTPPLPPSVTGTGPSSSPPLRRGSHLSVAFLSPLTRPPPLRPLPLPSDAAPSPSSRGSPGGPCPLLRRWGRPHPDE
jgi:hypothetical protein